MSGPVNGSGGSEDAGGPDEQVGSVGEEAAKLFGAMTDSLSGSFPGSQAGSGAGWADGLASLAEQAAEALREVDQHVATGAPECRWCPLCRTLHLVRETTPEVRDQLVGAARHLLQAATLVLDQAAPPARRREPGVERIDLDGPEDPDDPGDPNEETW